MAEIATPAELAEIAASASAVGGQVKTLSDLRFEKLRADFDAKFAKLEAENKELRAANAELYAYAQQRTVINDPEPVRKVEEVHAAEVVQDAYQEQEKMKAKQTYEEAYAQAIKSIGYQNEKSEPQPVGIKANQPKGDGM